MLKMLDEPLRALSQSHVKAKTRASSSWIEIASTKGTKAIAHCRSLAHKIVSYSITASG